jgi:tRNA modification GTPase
VVLIDTAGLRESADEVEAIGVARAARLAESADVLLWMGDPQDAPAHKQAIRVHGRSDLRDRASAPEGSIALSSVTGEGIGHLLGQISQFAKALLPAEDAIALNRRQADLIAEAAGALESAARQSELVVVAEELRAARSAFDRLTGRAGVEEVLDALFGRFCLGK